MELGGMTWTEIDRPIVVVPVGSCEQHGPHLPLHTDTVIAEAIAHQLAACRSDCVVSPPITMSASGEHAGFDGTLSIGTEAMTKVAVELARSADWASGIVFVNGHGGNSTAMADAAEVFREEQRRVLVWWPRPAGADLHAGRTETSLMLSLAPQFVHLDRAVAGPTPPIADLVTHGVQHVSPSGVLGDPAGASASEGTEIFGSLVDDLCATVADWVG